MEPTAGPQPPGLTAVSRNRNLTCKQAPDIIPHNDMPLQRHMNDG